MNVINKLKSTFNFEEIFIDFDYKDKRCKNSKAILKIFDYLNMKDIINFKNTNVFFNSKFDIEFLKKTLKNKILNRKEHVFLLKKILITQE